MLVVVTTLHAAVQFFVGVERRKQPGEMGGGGQRCCYTGVVVSVVAIVVVGVVCGRLCLLRAHPDGGERGKIPRKKKKNPEITDSGARLHVRTTRMKQSVLRCFCGLLVPLRHSRQSSLLRSKCSGIKYGVYTIGCGLM